MGSLLLVPPPPRPVPQDVYVIKLRRTYFGLHHEQADGTSRTRLVAFEDARRAAVNCDRLWKHRMANGEWPKRVLSAGESMELDDRGLMLSSKNELRVDRVPLEWLTTAMGRSGAGVDLVEELDDGVAVALRRHHVDNLGGRRFTWEDEGRHILMVRRTYLEELVRKRGGGDD